MRKLLAILLLLGNTAFAQTFIKTQLISGLDWAVAFDFAPDGRIFATKKGGWANQAVNAEIRVYDANGNNLSEFYDLSDSVHAAGEHGLLGITLDPNFTQNHFVYCYYVYSSAPSNGGDLHLRVQRFTESSNTGTQPVVLLDIDAPDSMPNIHVGGNLHFRPSDSTHIYVTIGDMGTGEAGFPYASGLNSPLGKILRISKYPGDLPPSDNPLFDDGNPMTGNYDYIWAYGLRNSFDFCFGPNDSLYSTENGTQLYDEVNLITRGGFYGWPHCEGPVDMDTTSLSCHAPNAILPLLDFQGPPLPALTGIIFYTDSLWSGQQNHLIVGDYNHADLTDVTLANAPAFNSVVSSNFWIDESNLNGITDISQGADGCIYVLELGDSIFGGIYRICPVPDSVYTWSLNAGPNPFSGETTIWFSVGKKSEVNLSLYDARGRLVETFIDGITDEGYYDVQLDAQISALSPGIYICVLRSEEFNSVLKLIVE